MTICDTLSRYEAGGRGVSGLASPSRVSFSSPQRQQQQQQQQQRHEHMLQESHQHQLQQQQLYSQSSTIDPALLQQLLQKMQEMERGLYVDALLFTAGVLGSGYECNAVLQPLCPSQA
jgi:hypothetical protein